MAERDYGHIVSTQWLEDHLSDENLIVIDGTWYLPGAPDNPAEQYRLSRIPGAVFFDIDAIADQSTDLPHMLPPADLFNEKVRELGVNNDSMLVVYDRLGLFSAPRVWWTFRAMGHDNIAVLDGGYKKWTAENRLVDTTEPAEVTPGNFTANHRTGFFASFEQVSNIVQDNGPAQILDARAAARFEGKADEPRPGVKKGRMPGSFNLPYDQLLNADGSIKSEEELLNLFQQSGITPQGKIVTTCGSGITASVLALGLALVGNQSTSVYDGSWAEWGARDDVPIITSET